MPWLEFHKDIHVTFGSEVFPQNRAEQRQLSDVVSLTKFLYLPFRNHDMSLFFHEFTPRKLSRISVELLKLFPFSNNVFLLWVYI